MTGMKKEKRMNRDEEDAEDEELLHLFKSKHLYWY